MIQVERIFSWSPWYPLKGSWKNSLIPPERGLYRIRRLERDDLDYIGETGRVLKKRLSDLRVTYGELMPYSDPHTAAPALWALRHRCQCEFEVSVLPIEGTTQWRKGIEALAISLARQEKGYSPTANFSRMPPGYRKSSQYNRGQGLRGGITPEQHSHHHPGIAPQGKLTLEPQNLQWCGHNWTDWIPLQQVKDNLPLASLGLYRIRDASQSQVLYVGEGKIRERLCSHLVKANNPISKQGHIFANANSLECSWICNPLWLDNQRKELENDLIAAHLLVTGDIPAAQFLGESSYE
ncbi:MAG: hypothetical protein EA343_08020 [Nodularia sp. (in: Bacteria)]|nr:MAG: hypothetical protein EA343_08020 [Nodularia sp. (in: cyanobacteria)]